ncbi:hypothetical protein SOVF_149270 [Spinacia oleracea]|nr:hypothetical protein SOVF_149270 [Spinacia oleracea]
MWDKDYPGSLASRRPPQVWTEVAKRAPMKTNSCTTMQFLLGLTHCKAAEESTFV